MRECVASVRRLAEWDHEWWRGEKTIELIELDAAMVAYILDPHVGPDAGMEDLAEPLRALLARHGVNFPEP